MSSEFYQLSGNNICSPCADIVRQNRDRPTHAAVVKGLVYGSVIAFGCFVAYALFIFFTNIEFALISIFIGYAIGRAVRQGSSGLGGRRCQVAAVALTYLAITFSSLPAGIRELQKAQAAKTEAASAQQSAPPTAGDLLVAVLLLSALAVASPILGLTSGFSGLISVFILGVGLQRAWQMTARDQRVLSGPFQREETVAVG